MSVFGPQLDPQDDLVISQKIADYFDRYNPSKRVSTQFNKTNTTFADITGLSVYVYAGKTYTFHAGLFIDADATGGGKYTMSGTCTATSIRTQVILIDNSSGLNSITARQTSLNSSSGQAGTTAGFCILTGTITVANPGTLTVQFAQNAANGTSSVLTGSFFNVKINP